MDNYFHAREDTPRHKTGEYNFDCIEALDTNLLNHHLEKLLQGKEINIPIYSFQEGRRHPDKSKKLKLLPNQVLILEGIHGMNEEVSNLVSSDKKFKIFISALTQLCINAHNRIFTTDTRLIRRIVRDRLFRGHTAAQTIEGWPSVRSAEGLYIFPFQEEADVIFNSAHIYEHALLKPYAERFLREVPHDHPSFAEANRLARFFDFFVPILEREVPENSILREFIGGSSFEY
tara:strand:- start:67 stop:762 length:696 start_codon:yes stop_codon:yes gene_type:complete